MRAANFNEGYSPPPERPPSQPPAEAPDLGRIVDSHPDHPDRKDDGSDRQPGRKVDMMLAAENRGSNVEVAAPPHPGSETVTADQESHEPKPVVIEMPEVELRTGYAAEIHDTTPTIGPSGNGSDYDRRVAEAFTNSAQKTRVLEEPVEAASEEPTRSIETAAPPAVETERDVPTSLIEPAAVREDVQRDQSFKPDAASINSLYTWQEQQGRLPSSKEEWAEVDTGAQQIREGSIGEREYTHADVSFGSERIGHEAQQEIGEPSAASTHELVDVPGGHMQLESKAPPSQAAEPPAPTPNEPATLSETAHPENNYDQRLDAVEKSVSNPVTRSQLHRTLDSLREKFHEIDETEKTGLPGGMLATERAELMAAKQLREALLGDDSGRPGWIRPPDHKESLERMEWKVQATAPEKIEQFKKDLAEGKSAEQLKAEYRLSDKDIEDGLNAADQDQLSFVTSVDQNWDRLVKLQAAELAKPDGLSAKQLLNKEYSHESEANPDHVLPTEQAEEHVPWYRRLFGGGHKKEASDEEADASQQRRNVPKEILEKIPVDRIPVVNYFWSKSQEIAQETAEKGVPYMLGLAAGAAEAQVLQRLNIKGESFEATRAGFNFLAEQAILAGSAKVLKASHMLGISKDASNAGKYAYNFIDGLQKGALLSTAFSLAQAEAPHLGEHSQEFTHYTQTETPVVEHDIQHGVQEGISNVQHEAQNVQHEYQRVEHDLYYGKEPNPTPTVGSQQSPEVGPPMAPEPAPTFEHNVRYIAIGGTGDDFWDSSVRYFQSPEGQNVMGNNDWEYSGVRHSVITADLMSDYAVANHEADPSHFPVDIRRVNPGQVIDVTQILTPEQIKTVGEASRADSYESYRALMGLG